LTGEGWPEPIHADSGNGAHLLYRVDLPADDGGLIERCLKALAARFNSDMVHVDQSVHNPARIWKLYGTQAGKGDSTTDRPHRMAKIIDAPALSVVRRELLEALAGTTPTSATPGDSASKHHGTNDQSFDLDDWLAKCGLDFRGPEPWQGGRKWVLPICPWDSSHTNDAAFIVQQANGAIGAGCRHDSCRDKKWHDLRDIVEPGWKDKRKKSKQRDDGPSQATMLVQLVKGWDYWRTAGHEAYVTVKSGDHGETWPVRSTMFRRMLSHVFYTQRGTVPNAEAVAAAINQLEARANFGGNVHPVFLRVAEHDGALYLDLMKNGRS
jgi:hypothetical protein